MAEFEDRKTLQVEVTQEDIDKGERGNMELCAISQALMRMHPYAYGHVEVDLPSVTVETADCETWVGTLPEFANQWAVNFDDGDEVQPIAFPLELRIKLGFGDYGDD